MKTDRLFDYKNLPLRKPAFRYFYVTFLHITSKKPAYMLVKAPV